MNEQTTSIITSTVEEIINKMGFSGDVSVIQIAEDTEDSIICNIATGDDSSFLIGQHGVNLQAIQHLARLIVRKKTDEKLRFVLDVNSYRQQKNQGIIDQANQAAEQAINERRPVIMKPMTTYERRIVHLELSKNKDITTESVGEGEGRKIIIKPSGSLI